MRLHKFPKVGLFINDTLVQSSYVNSDHSFEFALDSYSLNTEEENLIDVRILHGNEVIPLAGGPVQLDFSFYQTSFGEILRYSPQIVGWARNGKNLKKKLEVIMFVDGKEKCRRICSQYLKGLQNRGIEDGCYGFVIEVTDDLLSSENAQIEFKLEDGQLLKDGKISSLELRRLMFSSGDDNFDRSNYSFFNEGVVEIYSRAYIT